MSSHTRNYFPYSSIKRLWLLMDPDLKAHSKRVCDYSLLIGRQILMDDDQINALRIASSFHDIGNCFLPRYITCGLHKLTVSELNILESHTKIGAMIMKEYFTDIDVIHAVLHHHERFDGRGFPSGLAGAEIPLLSRIIRLADAFDFMKCSQHYSCANTNEQIESYIKCNSKSQFDPQLVSVTLRLLKSGIMS